LLTLFFLLSCSSSVNFLVLKEKPLDIGGELFDKGTLISTNPNVYQRFKGKEIQFYTLIENCNISDNVVFSKNFGINLSRTLIAGFRKSKVVEQDFNSKLNLVTAHLVVQDNFKKGEHKPYHIFHAIMPSNSNNKNCYLELASWSKSGKLTTFASNELLALFSQFKAK
jgi:hypothetical protein